MAVITIGATTLNSDDVVAVKAKDHLLLSCLGLAIVTAIAFLLSCILDSIGTAIGIVLVVSYLAWRGDELFGRRASYVVTVLLRNGTKTTLRKLTKAEALSARHEISKHMTR